MYLACHHHKAIMVMKWVESETLADAVIIRASWKFLNSIARHLKRPLQIGTKFYVGGP